MTFPMALAKQGKFKYLDQGTQKIANIRPVQLPEDSIRNIISFLDPNEPLCDFDINFDISLKTGANWHFGHGNITDNQYDFRLAAAVEITHGLGFNSNYFNEYTTLPQFYWIEDPFTTHLSYMSPFDSLLYGRFRPDFGETLGRYWYRFKDNMQIRSLPPILGKLAMFSTELKKFQRIGGLYGQNMTGFHMTDFQKYHARELYDQIGHFKIYGIELTDRTSLGIYNGHLDWWYWNTTEFLMCPGNHGGKSLESLMNNLNQGNLYGPLTLKVLAEIGHATKNNPKVLQFYTANKTDTGFVEMGRVSPFMASIKLKMGL